VCVKLLVSGILGRQLHDERRKQQGVKSIIRRSGQHPAFRNAQFMLAIWLCYLTGSIAGTWMNSRWHSRSPYASISILVVVAAMDQIWPLSVEGEKEQA